MSDNPSIIPYQDKREQLNSTLQLAWTENIRTGSNTLPLYEKVAVLLISWDCDDLDTDDEVSIVILFYQIVTNDEKGQTVKRRVQCCIQLQGVKCLSIYESKKSSPSSIVQAYRRLCRTGRWPGNLADRVLRRTWDS